MKDILKYKQQLEFDLVLGKAAEYAVSEDAARMLLEQRPYEDSESAQEQLAITDGLLKLVVRNRPPAISGVSGVHEVSLRAQKGGALSMAELRSTAAALRNSRVLCAWLSASPELEFPELDRLFFPLYSNESFERKINENILSDSEIADSASSALADIRRKIIRAEATIKDKLDSLVRSQQTSKYLQDAIVTMRAGRYVVPVKNEYRSEVKGLVHDISASGSTFFVEPEAVVEANNRIVTLRADEAQEIQRILYAYSAEVSDFAAQLDASWKAFLQIDCSLAKARYCLSFDGVMPKFSDGINLMRARHPLIHKDKVVPVDIPLGLQYNSMIITGPNTGGKTVTLKTLGLLTLMAMSGFLLPVKQGSTVKFFSQILVDIGDEQSIAQNLSTFSGHIKNIISILETADDNSLVLLDELGAGTDPAEGAALAIAVLDRFRQLGSTVAATTHYGELKVYALETAGVQNASCEFDVKSLSPTYRLNIGIPGRSNALLIGERLGLPQEIIESARRGMNLETRRFEDVLERIESIESEAAKKLETAQDKLEEADKKLEQAEKKQQELREQAEKELVTAQNRAKQLVADVTARAYALTDEIRQLEKDKQTDRQAALMRARAIAKTEAGKLFDMSDPVVAQQISQLLPVTQVAVGDIVVLRDLNQTAEVLTLPDKNKTVEVRAGNLKTRVALDKLGALPEGKTKEKKKSEPYVSKEGAPQFRSPQNELNIIGLTTEEASLEVGRFIDNAILSKLSIVYIIHGRGTGALRSAVQIQLKKTKGVKSYRLGRYGEGEDGVTVVELK